ncbi:MAG: DUF1015 domain-containing protein [Cyclobacteriaceae bacterium]|nr:DUF1015 domain-containing protein [Cyclobacteriaceae bacterium]
MADIRPIRAWRYNAQLSQRIDDLTSPLFDVVSERQRRQLYQEPFNSVHLSVPLVHNPAALLGQWKSTGVLVQDEEPSIYVYYQYFSIPGESNPLCRKGFICHIRAYPFEEGVILRHENTIPDAVNDRIELLRTTGLHVSPTHGLYSDPEYVLEKFMDEAIRTPLYETEDYQGVRDVMARITDPKILLVFLAHLHDKQIILADGHHRYESSLEILREHKASNPRHTGQEGYNFHLMYLTNTESGDLRILPTHRLIQNVERFDPVSLLAKLGRWFDLREISDPDTVPEVIHGKRWAFGLLIGDRAYKARLRPDVLPENHWPFPEAIKQLDLTVMHHFIIEKGLGIPGRDQRVSHQISFERSFTECLTRVMKQEVQMALITNEVSIDEVKAVCHSGFTMPQKSTYFYPKVICGFLFSSILEDEQ